MYHVIVHGDSGSAAFAWTEEEEEEDATFRYPDPGLVHLSFLANDSREYPIISAFIRGEKEEKAS